MDYTFPAALEPFMMLYHHKLITQLNPLWEPLNNMVIFKSDLEDFYECYEDSTDEAWKTGLEQCIYDTKAELDKLVSTFLSKNNLQQQQQ